MMKGWIVHLCTVDYHGSLGQQCHRCSTAEHLQEEIDFTLAVSKGRLSLTDQSVIILINFNTFIVYTYTHQK